VVGQGVRAGVGRCARAGPQWDYLWREVRSGAGCVGAVCQRGARLGGRSWRRREQAGAGGADGVLRRGIEWGGVGGESIPMRLGLWRAKGEERLGGCALMAGWECLLSRGFGERVSALGVGSPRGRSAMIGAVAGSLPRGRELF